MQSFGYYFVLILAALSSQWNFLHAAEPIGESLLYIINLQFIFHLCRIQDTITASHNIMIVRCKNINIMLFLPISPTPTAIMNL